MVFAGSCPIVGIDLLGLKMKEPPAKMGFDLMDVHNAMMLAIKAGCKLPGGKSINEMYGVLLDSDTPKVKWALGTGVPRTEHTIGTIGSPGSAKIKMPAANPGSGIKEYTGTSGKKYYFEAAVLHELVHAYQALTGTSEPLKEDEEKAPKAVSDCLQKYLECEQKEGRWP